MEEKYNEMFSISPVKIKFYDSKTGETHHHNHLFNFRHELDLENSNLYDMSGELIKEADQKTNNRHFLITLLHIDVLQAKRFLDYQYSKTPNKQAFLDYVEFSIIPHPSIIGGMKDLLKSWINSMRKTTTANSYSLTEFDLIRDRINWVLDLAVTSDFKKSKGEEQHFELHSFWANGMFLDCHEAWMETKPIVDLNDPIARESLRHMILVENKSNIVPVIRNEIAAIGTRLDEFKSKYNIMHCDIIHKNEWFLSVLTYINGFQKWFEGFTDTTTVISKRKNKPANTIEKDFSHKAISIAVFAMGKVMDDKMANEMLAKYSTNKSIEKLKLEFNKWNSTKKITAVNDANQTTNTKHLGQLNKAKELVLGIKDSEALQIIISLIKAFEVNRNKHQ